MGHSVRISILRLLALALFCLFAGQALADDWNVTRLRGEVFQFAGGAWQPLERGDIVPDDRLIRTATSGRLSLARGKEVIELGPNTQIRIFDKGGAKPFTTVQQEFGTVSVEAEVRNVQHFAVETPYLAAVVKGTHFTVVSGKSGGSVSVQRGHVAVEDALDHSNTLIAAGQQAHVTKRHGMTVSGAGKLPPVIRKGGSATARPAVPQKAADAKGAVEQAIKDLKAAQESGDAAAVAEAKRDLAEAAKEAEKAARDAEKAAKDAGKAAIKAADDAAKEAEKLAREEARAKREAEKAAQKAAEDAAKAAEKAVKDTTKDVKDTLKGVLKKGKG